MQLPFDLDLPIWLYVAGHFVFRAVSVLRESENQRAIPVNVEYQEVRTSALTPDQAETGQVETVHHSCSVRFSTDFADGRSLTTHNIKSKPLTDRLPGNIVQNYPNMNDVAKLKRRHDRRAATMGPALWPPGDAKSIFEHDDQKRKISELYQVERGLRKLTPAGDAYILTDKAHWRAVRNHYNPFAQRFSLARLLSAIAIGAALPLLSLLKLAPAAARIAPMPGVEAATLLAAYAAAGAIIGYILDRNFVWTFLITYIPAHAVMGWSFGPWPYSMLAAQVSFYARRAKHRRRLILMEA